MRKKITAILLMLVFCILQILPVYAQEDKVRMIDNAGLLSTEEAAALENSLDEISTRQNCDIVILTIGPLEGKTATAYADDYFDYNGYGITEERSGILFLISMEERDWALSTSGYGITAFTDAGLEYIINQVKPDLSAGNYAECFQDYAALCDKFLTQAYTDRPYDRSNLPSAPAPGQSVRIGIAIALGIIFGFIFVQKKKGELKTVRAKKSAANYITHSDITRSRDVFLYNQVSKTAKPKDTGSSTHTSSSGRTHGGSSGKF